MSELLIARQPIFNRYLEVVGYELLYRPFPTDDGSHLDGDHATMQVITDTFAQIGLTDLVQEEIAYINVTRNFIIGKYPIPFPPDQIVLEIVEDTLADLQLRDALIELSHQGYSIALDDVTSIEQASQLVHLANIIKIDLLGVNRSRLPEIVAYFHARRITLLAEKVETLQDLLMGQRLGFDLYQGFFLCKPNLIRGHRLDTSRLVLLRLLASVVDPSVDFRQLERIIIQDVNLSYKLLKLVNSAVYGRPTTIKSIREAVAFIGLNYLRSWMTLLLLTSVKDKPHELTRIAMQRARMCEGLGHHLRGAPLESFFLTGLLSVLDALLDTTLEEAISHLPLSTDVTRGLLEHEGTTGTALDMVIAYERGNWTKVLPGPLHPQDISKAYMDSLTWSDRLLRSLDQA
jgi:EAL and modified HD-GYP domain-containing signal transduction protein